MHEPPVECVRDGMHVKRGDDQVDEMYRKGEIRNELRTGDQ